MTGGRPAFVIFHTVDHFMGVLSNGEVFTPSRNPAMNALRAFLSLVRANVSTVQLPT